jgi:hypothetical protein
MRLGSLDISVLMDAFKEQGAKASDTQREFLEKENLEMSAAYSIASTIFYGLAIALGSAALATENGGRDARLVSRVPADDDDNE